MEDVSAVEAHGEHCQACGSTYGDFVYRVPDDVWAVITPKPETPGAGLLCPPCAAQRASKAGIYLEWTARHPVDEPVMPNPKAWPQCPTCKTPWVLRRVMTFSGASLGGYEWLWQRDCKHKSDPVVTPETSVDG